MAIEWLMRQWRTGERGKEVVSVFSFLLEEWWNACCFVVGVVRLNNFNMLFDLWNPFCDDDDCPFIYLWSHLTLCNVNQNCIQGLWSLVPIYSYPSFSSTSSINQPHRYWQPTKTTLRHTACVVSDLCLDIDHLRRKLRMGMICCEDHGVRLTTKFMGDIRVIGWNKPISESVLFSWMAKVYVLYSQSQRTKSLMRKWAIKHKDILTVRDLKPQPLGSV